MKKTYIIPAIELMDAETEGMLATSLTIFNGVEAPTVNDVDDILGREFDFNELQP